MSVKFQTVPLIESGLNKVHFLTNICDQLNIPIKYIGVGEGVNDLQLFDKKQFVDSLFAKWLLRKKYK